MYPREPRNDEEKEIQKRYQNLIGSAVNPVLREGNSDRRVAPPVKAFAQKNPPRLGMWSKASRTHVSHMDKGDFYSSEQSVQVKNDTSVSIELNGNVLKEDTPLLADEVIDASFMDVKELCEFYEREIEEARETETLLSLHLKATMMKVSDPIMFGHCIKVFFKDAFAKHGDRLKEIDANPNSGLAGIYSTVKEACSGAEAKQIMDDFEACYDSRPWLAMVNSDKGITNLHYPNDSKYFMEQFYFLSKEVLTSCLPWPWTVVIIDASMPNVVRDSGKMWNKLVSNFLLGAACGIATGDASNYICFLRMKWKIQSA